ncbi:MAG: tetratricopeptide repeat protein [Planctomycetia bacterium]|nr:tetratricopeptide repeat protein [Planctomycetia bacterium]
MSVPFAKPLLTGQSFRFAGNLESMSKREAERLIREHGGKIVTSEEGAVDWLVIGDWQTSLRGGPMEKEDLRWLTPQVREAMIAGKTHILTETQLWERLFPGNRTQKELTDLYTPTMLAELLDVTTTMVRHWYHRGFLKPARKVHKLPYFDLEEVFCAHRLAALVRNGATLDSIEEQLKSLQKRYPDSQPILADSNLVVRGSRLLMWTKTALLDTDGQMLLNFVELENQGKTPDEIAAEAEAEEREATLETLLEESDLTRTFHELMELHRQDFPTLQSGNRSRVFLPELRQAAMALEDVGKLAEAAEMYRNILFAGGANAEDSFQLGNLLYQQGNLTAARERFSMAVEMDEDFLEARASLGCVLAEMREYDLAISALEGAITTCPEYADAYYHLGKLFEKIGKSIESRAFFRKFLEQTDDPTSPWIEEARSRVASEDF